ncbi:hypothetical protein XELAEV_18046709mg [Xenopus laevis]|uniref:Small integral membrane protein 5 n=1 Tax=Xenopus laevis TaxID=8355 RepID=A0A974BTL0_XENLA|nr:hypothetical protein XELAEV_18046709mg [Xenopus laevis]
MSKCFSDTVQTERPETHLQYPSPILKESLANSALLCLERQPIMELNNLQPEVRKVGQDLLKRLTGLPQADTHHIVAFAIIIIFIGIALLLRSLGCCYPIYNQNQKGTQNASAHEDTML